LPIDFTSDSFEFLTAKIIISNLSFILCVIYRPHPPTFAPFLTSISAFLEQLTSVPTPAIVCGDFNWPDERGTGLVDLFSSFDFKQAHTPPSRLSRHLDLCFSSNDLPFLNNLTCSALPSFSDHLLLITDLPLPVSLPSQRPVTSLSLDIQQTSLIDVGVGLSAAWISHSSTASELSLESCIKYLPNIVPEIFTKFSVKRSVRRTPSNRPNFWLTRSALNAKRHKRFCERRYKRTGHINDLA
jgi:hypothetical protein